MVLCCEFVLIVFITLSQMCGSSLFCTYFTCMEAISELYDGGRIYIKKVTERNMSKKSGKAEL